MKETWERWSEELRPKEVNVWRTGHPSTWTTRARGHVSIKLPPLKKKEEKKTFLNGEFFWTAARPDSFSLRTRSLPPSLHLSLLRAFLSVFFITIYFLSNENSGPPNSPPRHPPCLQTTQLYGSTFSAVRMVSQIQFQIERDLTTDHFFFFGVRDVFFFFLISWNEIKLNIPQKSQERRRQTRLWCARLLPSSSSSSLILSYVLFPLWIHKRICGQTQATLSTASLSNSICCR